MMPGRDCVEREFGLVAWQRECVAMLGQATNNDEAFFDLMAQIMDKQTPRKFKRCRRVNEAGVAHALTFSCFRGQRFLDRDRPRRWMVEAIEHARGDLGYHLWAYVLMPEHVHLLVWPSVEPYDISQFLRAVKEPVAKRAAHFVRVHAPGFLPKITDVQPNGRRTVRFWQRGGGYDRNYRQPLAIWTMIDYIHANPVRRGLCDRPGSWYWSSAALYEGSADGPLVIDRETLPDDPRS